MQRLSNITPTLLVWIPSGWDMYLVFLYTQIISAFGYDGSSKVQDITAQWGIRLATGLLPAVLILLGLFFFSKYPIDKATEDWVETETLTKHRAG